MIRVQFNCTIVCKTHEEASAIEAFLNEQNINAYVKQYKGNSIIYLVYDLSFNDIALIRNFRYEYK